MFAGRQVEAPRVSHASHHALPLRTCEGGASTSGRQHVSHSRRRQHQKAPSIQRSVAAPDRTQVLNAEESVLADTTAAAPLLCDPDTFALGSGELSTLAETPNPHPADVFRCAGCKLEECQVWFCSLLGPQICVQADTSNQSASLRDRLDVQKCYGGNLWMAICGKYSTQECMMSQ